MIFLLKFKLDKIVHESLEKCKLKTKAQVEEPLNVWKIVNFRQKATKSQKWDVQGSLYESNHFKSSNY